MNSDKQFRSPAVMVWPLLFTIVMVYFTAEMTGGIGLKALGGEVAGGKKYIALFAGCAAFFALTARYIPKDKRHLVVALYFLAGVLQIFSDLFPFLPAPLNYVNLLIPPSDNSAGGDFSFGVTRMGALAGSAGVIANYMIARYGLRGLLRGAGDVSKIKSVFLNKDLVFERSGDLLTVTIPELEAGDVLLLD